MPTETLDASAPFEPVKANIAKLKKENATLVFDYESAKGNKLARSHVASLRSMKSEIESKRVELKAEALAFGRKVDAAAKELTAEVVAMIDVHAKPLEEIEAREKAKMLSVATPVNTLMDAFSCEQAIEQVEAVVIDDSWPASAKKTKENTLACLRARLDELVKAENAAAELAKLRAEKEALEKAAADSAREAARAKREEEIRKEAAERAVAAERERALAAEAKAAREAADLKAAEEKRAANKKHREKILKEAGAALAALACAPEDAAAERIGDALARAIADGKIPHTTIKF